LIIYKIFNPLQTRIKNGELEALPVWFVSFQDILTSGISPNCGKPSCCARCASILEDQRIVDFIYCKSFRAKSRSVIAPAAPVSTPQPLASGFCASAASPAGRESPAEAPASTDDDFSGMEFVEYEEILGFHPCASVAIDVKNIDILNRCFYRAQHILTL
jgi:hypothetical protein